MRPDKDGTFRVTPYNVKGSWSDKDYVAFHCFFTCMTHFVDRECGGIDDFESKYIVGLQTDLANEGVLSEESIEWAFKTAELYRWYNSVDWDTYDFVGSTEVVEKLKEAADCFQGWWR